MWGPDMMSLAGSYTSKPGITLVARAGIASPGIGVEFESSIILFTKDIKGLSDQEQAAVKQAGFDAKGKAAVLREGNGGSGAKFSGDDWELTADSTGSTVGRLTAEYILNGKKIKLGSERVVAAAEEVYENLKKWDPKTGEEFDIADNKMNPWKLDAPNFPVLSIWSRQITVPMPLGAINDLMKQSKVNPPKPSVLLPTMRSKMRSNVWVNDFFLAENPGGLTTDVGEDVRGFLSLLLSYAKAGNRVANGQSVKEMTSIMPRTSFDKMYKLIEDKLEGKDLWTIVNKLACYENPEEDAEHYAPVDPKYCSQDCSGETEINGNFEQVEINVCDGAKKCPVNVKAWIQGLKDGKDLLSDADKIIDGQIGGYGALTEHRLHYPNEELALFEFRDLPSSQASQWSSSVEAAEKEIVEYHKQFPGN